MNSQKLIYNIFISTFLLLCATGLFAQTYAERALYRDAFSSKDIEHIEVLNKYGSIHIKMWEKDSIIISTDVYLSSTSKSKLDKLKDGIKIKYDRYNSTIKAQTIFGVNKTAFMKELQSVTRSLSPSTEKRIEINYEISMPKNIALKIKNQYGDIFLEDFDQKLQIDQSNGSFKANNLTGETNLKFNFTSAMIADMKEVVMDLNYSTINFGKAVSVNCESTSSEIFADAIGVLKLKSSRDKITIGTLDYVYGSASYTTTKIQKLNKEIDGYYKYGSVNIDRMSKEVSLIDIDSERTDIKLFIPKSIDYKYDILYHENADLLLPTYNQQQIDNLDMEGMKAVKGLSGKDPKLDIRIRAHKRCLIHIMRVSEN